MTNPEPDPDADAALARVNALRAARGLPPIVERDPAIVRRGLATDRDSMMVAVAALHRSGCGATVPDAMDQTMEGKPSVAAFDLPPGVALTILNRTPDAHAPDVFNALDAELRRFSAKAAAAPTDVRGLAELCVHRIADAVRTAIVDGIADGLPARGSIVAGATITHDMRAQAADVAAGITVNGILDRLRLDLEAMTGLRPAADPSDSDHETRCRRAAVVNALAQLRGDADMQSEAFRLALIVCRDRPDMRPSDVFRTGAPVLLLPADATDADVDTALCAELEAIAADSGGDES